ncbi:MAG: DNA repair protein RecN [candidate division Zixibacteria bacterium]|jgi:DNA repair protein RecN (Recombination protein N)|nr:DNA repair protein RecN [candidate division Zixibacteria bacterium]
MLTRLKIRNVALVDSVDLAFGPGLTVLTGETGAGKSVIVTALALVLGDRADREYVRHGAAAAIVEADFDISPLGPRYAKDNADYIADSTLSVFREITADGKSRVKIRGEAATLARLNELTRPIAEILGQHANQMLMNEDNHLLFLDYFGSLDSARESVRVRFSHWEQVAAELRRVQNQREQLARERELLLFQRDEIEKADVRPGEEEKLIAEKRKLDSSRELMSAANQIQQLLDGDEVSALSLLREARKCLDDMAEIDKSLSANAGLLAEIDFQIEDLRRTIEQYGASIEDDPARLEEINARLDELYRLKKKYGGSEESIVQTLASIHFQLNDRPDIDDLVQTLSRENEARRAAYAREAVALSEARRSAAVYLGKLVKKELAELAIDNGGFEFEFQYENHPDGIVFKDRTVRPLPHGLETGRFLFSANPGEPLRSLVRTASGGEISRVLLALKAAEKKNHKALHPLLVFDEVDAGIGGQTALEVGRKIKKLSENRQVFVITHLHQIARLADHHFAVRKSSDKDRRAVIRVTELDPKGVERELERMVALPE